jgi:hypothetical protein
MDLHVAKEIQRWALASIVGVALAACGGCKSRGDGPLAQGQRAVTQTSGMDSSSDENLPPRIDGRPAQQASVGKQYSFQPRSWDPDDDTVSFGIRNRPPWASFNTANGRLRGTPGEGDVGIFRDIRITVTDGEDSVALQAFAIEVMDGGGGFKLSWSRPTTNIDGSRLADLAGYRVHLGIRPGAYTSIIDVNNPAQTTYTFNQLNAGTYYVALTAVNRSGLESERTAELSIKL